MSHFRKLLTVESEVARQWYMQEATQQNWSVRTLERQNIEYIIVTDAQGHVVRVINNGASVAPAVKY